MKNKFLLYISTLPLIYLGCGSIEVSNDGARMSSTNYSLDRTTSHYTSRAKIELIKHFTTHGTAVDIALSSNGNVAYIASGEGGLEVIDISNPYSPKYIISYDLFEYTNYVEVIDDIVYAAYITENTRPYMDIKAYDISNPYSPKYIGSNVKRSTVAHYQAKKDGVMVQTDDEGIAIYKQNGRTYQRAGSYSLGDHAYAVALARGYIFVANGRDGLSILKTDAYGSSGRFIK